MDEYYEHFYRTNGLLKWARSMVLPEGDEKDCDQTRVMVNYGGLNQNNEWNCCEEVFSVGTQTDVFITKSLILWTMKQNITNKIGKGNNKLYINDT